MITERDKKILRYIEDKSSVTIDQCNKVFFKNNVMGYDQARKRLRYLNKEGHIKRYRKDPKSETVYYMDKKLKVHDLKINDVIIALSEFQLSDCQYQKIIEYDEKTNYIIDAIIVIENRIPILIEVDYTHYTSEEKIKHVLYHLENKNNFSYIFIVVKQNIEELTVKNICSKSKLVQLPWNFNKNIKLADSLSLVIGTIKSSNTNH